MPWPIRPCPPNHPIQTAADVLNQIVLAAAQAGAPNLDQIIMLANRCAANNCTKQGNLAANNGDNDAHSLKVEFALTLADRGMWFQVANELEHGV